MELKDYIKTYNAFSQDECAEIIEYYEKNKDRQIRSQTYSGVGNYDQTESSSRTSKQVDVTYGDDIDYIISNKISSYFIEYHFDLKKKYKEVYASDDDYDPVDYLLSDLEYVDEGYSIVKYDSDRGYFDWHFDRIDGDALKTRRVFSCIIYLNDNFEEGETDFKFLKIKPETGKILFFPSHWQYVHKGCVPIDGNKYVITTWLHFKDNENMTIANHI